MEIIALIVFQVDVAFYCVQLASSFQSDFRFREVATTCAVYLFHGITNFRYELIEIDDFSELFIETD